MSTIVVQKLERRMQLMSGSVWLEKGQSKRLEKRQNVKLERLMCVRRDSGFNERLLNVKRGSVFDERQSG